MYKNLLSAKTLKGLSYYKKPQLGKEAAVSRDRGAKYQYFVGYNF